MSVREEHRKIPENVMMAIQKMFLCEGFEQEFKCFYENYEDLKECSFFMYSDTIGVDFPEYFKWRTDEDFALLEIGVSEKYYAIDALICDEMLRTSKTDYALDICVELDTQAVSYLKNIFKNVDEINIPESKKGLFLFLSNSNVNYSDIFYVLENARKITKDCFEECYLNLKSYEVFKNLDLCLYMSTGQKKFMVDEGTMAVTVDTLFSDMKKEEFYRAWKDVYDIQENIFCLLAKAVLIENGNSKKSAENKMKMLIEFVNDSLGVYCEREMAICYYFFKHDKNTEKFFKKTKVNSKNVRETIESMAWDLTHVRLIERMYDFTFLGPVKFGIHPILTYDTGLREVLRLYPIKKIAIYEGYVIPWFKTSFREIFPLADELIHHSDVVRERKKVFISRNIECIKKELEICFSTK